MYRFLMAPAASKIIRDIMMEGLDVRADPKGLPSKRSQRLSFRRELLPRGLLRVRPNVFVGHSCSNEGRQVLWRSHLRKKEMPW
jgi:hypothetical protein